MNTTANYRDLDVLAVGPVVRDLSGVFDRYWNSASAVPIGAIVDRAYGTADLEAIRVRLHKEIAAADYPYPIDQDLDELVAQAAELRDNLVWARGRIIADDPESIARGEESDDVAHRCFRVPSVPILDQASREGARPLKLANEGCCVPPHMSFICTSRSSCTRPPGRVSAVLAQRQDRRQIAPHLDPQRPVLGHQHNRLDQRPDRLPHLLTVLGREGVLQRRHLLPVNLGQPRDAAAGFGSLAVASSASSATRRRSSACIRAFIEGSYKPSVSPGSARRSAPELGQLAAPSRQPVPRNLPAAGSTRP